jgi:hypothetical protein
VARFSPVSKLISNGMGEAWRDAGASLAQQQAGIGREIATLGLGVGGRVVVVVRPVAEDLGLVGSTDQCFGLILQF